MLGVAELEAFSSQNTSSLCALLTSLEWSLMLRSRKAHYINLNSAVAVSWIKATLTKGNNQGGKIMKLSIVELSKWVGLVVYACFACVSVTAAEEIPLKGLWQGKQINYSGYEELKFDTYSEVTSFDPETARASGYTYAIYDSSHWGFSAWVGVFDGVELENDNWQEKEHGVNICHGAEEIPGTQSGFYKEGAIWKFVSHTKYPDKLTPGDSRSCLGDSWYSEAQKVDLFTGWSQIVQRPKITEPTELYASGGTYREHILITWRTVSSAAYYRLYRSEEIGKWGNLLGSFNGKELEYFYQDKQVESGRNYYYTVVGFDSNNVPGIPSLQVIGYRYGDTELKCADCVQSLLKSPVYTKYNTFLGQYNFLELVSAGSKDIEIDLSLFTNQGSKLGNSKFTLHANSQQDIDINSLFRQLCKNQPRLCKGMSDIDGNGVFDSYGLARVSYDSSDTDKVLLGRMSHYRPGTEKSYSFAFATEFANPQKGVSFSIANTMDPQNSGLVVPNWAEIINLDTNSEKKFMYELYDHSGAKIASYEVTVGSLGEMDLPAGHDLLDDGGRSISGVYLVKVIPEDMNAPYLFSVSRYAASDASMRDYSYAFSLPAKSSEKGSLILETTNTSYGDVCTNIANWIEVVNTENHEISVNLKYFDAEGQQKGEELVKVPPFSQHHFYATDKLDGDSIGQALVTSQDGGILAQSMVYYRDCKNHRLKTAYATQGYSESEKPEWVTSFNTFLEMNNIVRALSGGNLDRTISYRADSFSGKGFQGEVKIPNNGAVMIAIDTKSGGHIDYGNYGLSVVGAQSKKDMVGHLLRIHKGNGELDFIMPIQFR